MAGKKHKPQGGKPHGHYCRICGQHKANEKFSGKGHAAHICKACSSLSVAERNTQVTLRKIEGMAFRYLSEQEIKWLRGKMNDHRPEVAEAAREAHGIKFPRHERGKIKKGLIAHSLELFLHGTVWDEGGDEVSVHARVSLNSSGLLRKTNLDAPEDECETEVTVDKQDARRFLKSVIHELDALFWDEDLSDAEASEVDFDPYLDILPEFRPDADEDWDSDFDDDDELEASIDDSEPNGGRLPDESRPPLWSLRLELSNRKEKAVTFYNQLHDEPRELYLSLMEWFDLEMEIGDDFEEGSDAPEE